MLTLILSIVLGLTFSFFAVNNSQDIALQMFGSSLALPLYVVIALCFLLGTFVTSVFSIFDWTLASLDTKKKENSYDNAIRVNNDLRRDLEKIQAENSNLKEEITLLKTEESEHKSSERKENVKNFFHKLTHPAFAKHSHLS